MTNRLADVTAPRRYFTVEGINWIAGHPPAALLATVSPPFSVRTAPSSAATSSSFPPPAPAAAATTTVAFAGEEKMEVEQRYGYRCDNGDLELRAESGAKSESASEFYQRAASERLVDGELDLAMGLEMSLKLRHGTIQFFRLF